MDCKHDSAIMKCTQGFCGFKKLSTLGSIPAPIIITSALFFVTTRFCANQVSVFVVDIYVLVLVIVLSLCFSFVAMATN